MTLFHKIALAATLLALPKVAHGQETSLAEQIAADVAREHAACAQYKLPQAGTCVAEVEGAEQLLNGYDLARKELETTMWYSVSVLAVKMLKATEEYYVGKPLLQPSLPGENAEDALQRNANYSRQMANADIARMTAEQQCIADKAKLTEITRLQRAYRQVQFANDETEFPFLQRFPSYEAVKKAMFDMLDRYQKEVDAISCAVQR